jgi:hypothetical protein
MPGPRVAASDDQRASGRCGDALALLVEAVA